MGRVLGVIPARLESTRLARKALRLICGRPMVVRVYEGARGAACLDGLLVATDAEEIMACCREHGVPAMLTSTAHRSGTDRLAEVMAREPADIFVNIQGDEPMITGEHIELLLRPFQESPETQVSTLKVALDPKEAANPNKVKVVTGARGRALYFSRAGIPFDRDSLGHARYYKHLGIYAYTAAALKRFFALEASPLEQLEKLEQLRFLENGIPMTVVETTADTIHVDTEEDLQRVDDYFLELETTRF